MTKRVNKIMSECTFSTTGIFNHNDLAAYLNSEKKLKNISCSKTNNNKSAKTNKTNMINLLKLTNPASSTSKKTINKSGKYYL